MTYTPLEEVWETVGNRYRVVILAAREARRINKAPKEDEKVLKPTVLAIKRLVGKQMARAGEED